MGKREKARLEGPRGLTIVRYAPPADKDTSSRVWRRDVRAARALRQSRNVVGSGGARGDRGNPHLVSPRFSEEPG